jgi:hypothetical protein
MVKPFNNRMVRINSCSRTAPVGARILRNAVRTKTINRLGAIAHHYEPGPSGRSANRNLGLQPVSLVLVKENAVERSADFGSELGLSPRVTPVRCGSAAKWDFCRTGPDTLILTL